MGVFIIAGINEIVCHKTELAILHIHRQWVQAHIEFLNCLTIEKFTLPKNNNQSAAIRETSSMARSACKLFKLLQGHVAEQMSYAAQRRSSGIQREYVVEAILALATKTCFSIAHLTWHQPRLYPGGRTMQQLCVLHSDILTIGEAISDLLEASLHGKACHDTVEDNVVPSPMSKFSEHTKASPSQQTSFMILLKQYERIELGLGILTEMLFEEMVAACKNLWGVAAENMKKGNKNPVAEEQQVFLDLISPLYTVLSRLHPVSLSALVPAAIRAALHARAGKVEILQLTSWQALRVSSLPTLIFIICYRLASVRHKRHSDTSRAIRRSA